MATNPVKPKVKCTECESYSFQAQRCKLGKIKPPTISGAVDAARWMGVSYICMKWEKYEKFLAAFRARLEVVKLEKERMTVEGMLAKAQAITKEINNG